MELIESCHLPTGAEAGAGTLVVVVVVVVLGLLTGVVGADLPPAFFLFCWEGDIVTCLERVLVEVKLVDVLLLLVVLMLQDMMKVVVVMLLLMLLLFLVMLVMLVNGFVIFG